jgi:transposase
LSVAPNRGLAAWGAIFTPDLHDRGGDLEWGRIRALDREGLSQREIAKRLNVNRRTVARMLMAKTEPPRYTRRRSGSQLDALMPMIQRALRKQPDIKAPQLTALLRAKGDYQGSVDLVRRRLAMLRAECGMAHAEYLPGAELHFDWVEMPTRRWVGGVERRVYALVALLPYSGAHTAHFSFDATIESFLEGHVKILQWLRGVPRLCVYRDLLCCVAKRDGRGALHWNRRFRELRNYYAFRSHLDIVGSRSHDDIGFRSTGVAAIDGRSTGVAPVNRQPTGVATINRRPTGASIDSQPIDVASVDLRPIDAAVERLKQSFWPTYRLGGLVYLDRLYAAWRDECNGNGQSTAVNGAHPPPISRLLAEDRAALSRLPNSGFDYSLRRRERVPPNGYIRYGASFYGVPLEIAAKHVDLHASRDEVWIVSRGRKVAAYRRSYKPGEWLPG